MLDLPNNPTALQRMARRMLTIACVALAMGLMGAVAARGIDQADTAVRFVDDVVAEELSDVRLAAGETSLDTPPVTGDAGAGVSPAPAVPATELMITSSPRVLWMEVTAYCPCSRCCGDDSPGITASGKPVSYNNGRFVAADTRLLPFGTKLIVPGYAGDEAIEVIDRGGAIKGHKLDLYFPTHEAALQWGRQWVAVTVLD